MPAQEAQIETICGLCVTPVQHSQHLVAPEMGGRTYSTRFSSFLGSRGYSPFVQLHPAYTREGDTGALHLGSRIAASRPSRNPAAPRRRACRMLRTC